MYSVRKAYSQCFSFQGFAKGYPNTFPKAFPKGFPKAFPKAFRHHAAARQGGRSAPSSVIVNAMLRHHGGCHDERYDVGIYIFIYFHIVYDII